MKKEMVQKYPVENIRYRKGTAKECFAMMVQRARKSGIAQNLNTGSSQIARFLVSAEGVTAVLQPVFVRALLKDIGRLKNDVKKAIKNGEEEKAELSSNVKLLKGALAPHRQLSSDIATSKDIARRNLRSLGKKGGFTYKCRDCSMYFTTKNKGIRCRYCKSGDIVRVRLSGTKRK